jgi:hypothetical protein
LRPGLSEADALAGVDRGPSNVATRPDSDNWPPKWFGFRPSEVNILPYFQPFIHYFVRCNIFYCNALQALLYR